VARCDDITELVVIGGCGAEPMWRAQLMSSRPFAVTDSANAAGWTCTARNTSEKTELELVAEVYCAKTRR
jgi:hypothetical protein